MSKLDTTEDVKTHLEKRGLYNPGQAKRPTIKSWLGVFSTRSKRVRLNNVEKLKEYIKDNEYQCVGTSHSYNGIQITDSQNSIDLRHSNLDELHYDHHDHTVTAGPSITVRELKEHLVKHGRQLSNAGNYMDQTVIGAFITGTHGFGKKGVMAEAIESLTFLDGSADEVTLKRGDPEFNYVAVSFGLIAPIIRMQINTIPTSQYRCETCLCRFNDLEVGGNTAFAVFPYSDEGNPLIAHNKFTELPTAQEPTKRPSSWGIWESLKNPLLKYYWAIDRHCPPFRRLVQRQMLRLEQRTQRDVITGLDDIDYLYDPYPLVELDQRPIFTRAVMKPTHTSYNVAFFVPLDQTKDAVRAIITRAEELSKESGGEFALRNFIGCRVLDTESDLVFAGNYQARVTAIDLYSNPSDAPYLWDIQAYIFDRFDCRPHWGKAHLESYIVERFRSDYDKLKEIRRKYYKQSNKFDCEAGKW